LKTIIKNTKLVWMYEISKVFDQRKQIAWTTSLLLPRGDLNTTKVDSLSLQYDNFWWCNWFNVIRPYFILISFYFSLSDLFFSNCLATKTVLFEQVIAWGLKIKRWFKGLPPSLKVLAESWCMEIRNWIKKRWWWLNEWHATTERIGGWWWSV